MEESKLRPGVHEEERRALLDIVREDFSLHRRIAELTNAQIMAALSGDALYYDAFIHFDQYGSIDAHDFYQRERRREAELTSIVGRVIRVHEGDNCVPSLRLLVHNTTRDKAVFDRIRNVTHREPLVIPACDIPDEELFRAIRKAG